MKTVDATFTKGLKNKVIHQNRHGRKIGIINTDYRTIRHDYQIDFLMNCKSLFGFHVQKALVEAVESVHLVGGVDVCDDSNRVLRNL